MRSLRIGGPALSCWLYLAALVPCPHPAAQEVPASPSEVTIEPGTNVLLVRKPSESVRPFEIRGVCWSPATRAPRMGPDPLHPGTKTQYGFFFDWAGRNPQGHEILPCWLRDETSARHAQDLAVMRDLRINVVRLYENFGADAERYPPVLDDCYRNGIMVVMGVAVTKADLDTERYLDVVRACRDHPAILMWAIGNEWNRNKFYDAWTLAEASARVNQVALEIKDEDVHHPVSSILGDAFDEFTAILRACRDIDVWGLNVYRGESFGDLFGAWKRTFDDAGLTVKPMYLSEFGIDSFATADYLLVGGDPPLASHVTGSEDRRKQFDVNAMLHDEIRGHLSKRKEGDVCLGGMVFEFNDELWKVGNFNVGLGNLVDYDGPDGIPQTGDDDSSYDEYDPEGFVAPDSAPDGVLNEEYFGMVDADRVPKLSAQVYNRFIRGDANDDGGLDISDAMKILFHVFLDQEVADPAACDADDKGGVNVSDVIHVLLFLFQDGPAPPAPFPDLGLDPSP